MRLEFADGLISARKIGARLIQAVGRLAPFFYDPKAESTLGSDTF
jgi:hypothetical protein